MAELRVTGLDDVFEALLRQEKAAVEAVPEMLKAGGEVLRDALRDEALKLNDTGRGTGALAESVKLSKLKERNGEQYVVVSPTGKDSHGVRNATKGFVLNYGRSNMQARPWFTGTVEKNQGEVTAAMRRVWEAKQRDG